MAALVESDRITDSSEAYSDGWWLEHLGGQLYARYPRVDMLWQYFIGEPPLPEGADSARSAYQKFQRKARTNYAELIVSAVQHRMRTSGFRTGADGDDNGDREARRIWMENDLDIGAADVHQTFLALGDAYTTIDRDADTGRPLIVPEDPRQVITAHDPRLPRRVTAALKVYRDEAAKTEVAYLYLPGRVRRAYRGSPDNGIRLGTMFRAKEWTWADEAFLPPTLAGAVPVVRFRNARGQGEYEMHLDHLDRINHMTLQRMVVATMQAFRQRAIKGDLPETDERGNPIDYNQLFVADPGALWQMPEGVDIWESSEVNLTPILESVRADVLQLAAVTFTPQHLMMPEASGRSGGSAEAAALTREGIVFKTEDRIARANIGWRSAMSLAFRILGDDRRADLTALEPIWAPAERLTLAERADAASKATDVPWRSKMTELWGFNPEVVDRMETERGADAFLQAALASLNGPQAAPAAPAAPAGQPVQPTPPGPQGAASASVAPPAAGR